MDVQSGSRVKKIWEGTFALTIAGLITKILSAGYRIPYQNIAGDLGFYIYQQAYPIYGIALIFSTYGFPVIISKLLVEKNQQNDHAAVVKILYITFFTLFSIGLLLFSLLYWGAGLVARWMGDENLFPLIKVISFSFLLLPFISVLRGSFQGQGIMIPTAVSQVTEQFIRVVTILVASFLLLDQGYSAYEAGAGAIFGSITGGFAAILTLLFFIFKRKHKLKNPLTYKSTVRSRDIVRVLLTQGITICISALLLILFQLIDSFTVYSLLTTGGMDETVAKQVKGIYDRGQPLIQLGTIVATSLSLSLVPLIASAKVRKDLPFIHEKVNLSIRLSIVVGVGAAIGLACVLEPTNKMLFKNNFGTNVLIIIGLSILFTSLSQTITAILQGLGHPYLPALSVIVGMFVKWQLNQLLIPELHTVGAAIATVIAFCVITGLHLFILHFKLPGAVKSWLFVKHVFFATLIMAIVIVGYLSIVEMIFPSLLTSRIFASFESISAVFLGGFIYLFFILKGRVFSEEEISLLPISSKGKVFIDSMMKRW
ncbi:putative polysaccharide biosynthesis protein [Ferdinandcohnia quinoae]|uniref:Polysaccharide biosynthesis protein n=1 Tax=Fredinandcohnia quinoae TaxID=2918902 RepID=A0AAW5EA69_9BACI|nr:polysaccharide biosynthesis protein [Fredinandcohnia sp. SECRCQ15]MCH1626931.1 polysaccharide biosynthesis protein [Fredinandcohnia sp. SECRCQ15]